MATEAEIIPELKVEEEITKPISELKKSEGGLLDMPAGTDECLDKANNVELASNGVETSSTVVSPEVSQKTSEEDEKVSRIEVVADRDSPPEEKRGSIEEELSQNGIETNKQEGNLELKKQDSITNPDQIIDSSNEADEIVTEAGSSNLIHLEEIKDSESEKLPVLEDKEEVTEATDPIETSVTEKDQIISDSTVDTLTSKAAETSDINDHETTSELQNRSPQEEAACVHEPAAEVGEKLEEVSKEPELELEPEHHPIPDISNSSVSEEIVKGSTKEDESIPLELTENASSSVELEDSKNDTAETESTPAADETDEKKLVPTELALEPEVKEVEQTEAVATELASEQELNEVEAVPRELALEPEVKEVEDSQDTKVVATVLVSELEVKEVEETKVVATESASEPKVNEVEQIKAEVTESASKPEVNGVEETKAVPTELASEPEVIEVEETKAVPTELALEPEVKETEETKAVPTELASEPDVKEIEETKAVPTELVSELELKEVESQAVPTELASEPEVKEVKQTKVVATELALEPEVNEVEPKAITVDETDAADRAIQVEEPKDQTSAAALPEAVVEHETTSSQASITVESKEIETSALPSEKQETRKIEEQTTEVEGASNVEVETSEKALDKELIKEELVKATNETTVNEVSKQDQAVVETPQIKENEIVENQIVCEDKTVQHPSQASSTMPIEEVPGNISLSDLLQRSEEEKIEVADRVIEEKELTVSKEAEAAAPVEDAENIQDEHNKIDSGSDAPVMIEAPKDTETKPHKKSQNIVSKAISKVKKVITGKSSSNSKEPKVISPEGGEK